MYTVTAFNWIPPPEEHGGHFSVRKPQISTGSSQRQCQKLSPTFWETCSEESEEIHVGVDETHESENMEDEIFVDLRDEDDD